MKRRPLIRRFGRTARDVVYRLITLGETVLRSRSRTLLPPAHLRLYYYRTLDPARFERACTEARTELAVQGLQPHHRILDIGSGIGNLALGLVGYLEGGYDGIEIHREAVEWCQRNITPRHPEFRFHHADLMSHAYNPGGKLSASEYRFPFADRSFDYILLSSVFTHMLPEDVSHYAREISRLLAPNGVCVGSFFLLDDESRRGVEQGRSFMTFEVVHPSQVCRFHDAAVPESAVAFEESFVRATLHDAGLQVRDWRRGRWWSGEAHDQDVLAITRSAANVAG
jgi:SAM-dependent methyltransferase